MTYRPPNPPHGMYNVRFLGKLEMTAHLFESEKMVRKTHEPDIFTTTQMIHLMFLESLSRSEIPNQISTPSIVAWLESKLVTATASILYSFCRSTIHLGPDSDLVMVQVGSLFPSTVLGVAMKGVGVGVGV